MELFNQCDLWPSTRRALKILAFILQPHGGLSGLQTEQTLPGQGEGHSDETDYSAEDMMNRNC